MAANNSGLYKQELTNRTNSVNRDDYWTRNYQTGEMTHWVNGRGWVVPTNDSHGRYPHATNAYNEQNGGVSVTGTELNPTGFERYQELYSAGSDAQKKAAQGQIDAAVNTLKTGLDKTNSIYDQNAKNAYINYMMGQKNMNQQLAAQGLGKTGASESTRLAANVDYNSNLNSNEQARQQALQDIYNKIAEVQADGAKTMADIDASSSSAMANAYINMLNADQSNLRSDRDYRAQQEQQYTDNLNNMVDGYISAGMTGETIYNIMKKMDPSLTRADFNVYYWQRLATKQQAKNDYTKGVQEAQALAGNK